MGTLSYTLFDTALGPCGLAWSANGITAVQLPEADEARTQSRLLRRLGRAGQARRHFRQRRCRYQDALAGHRGGTRRRRARFVRTWAP